MHSDMHFQEFYSVFPRVLAYEEGKRGGDWGERVRDVCYKNPPLFISAGAGVRNS